MKRLLLAAAIAAVLPCVSVAAPIPVSQAVAICDPNTAGNCLTPNSSGQFSDAQSAAFAGAVVLTPATSGWAATPQRSVGVLATVAGNVTFVFPDASTLTLPVQVGWQTFPFQCVGINSTTTTATASYWNLK